VGYSGGKVFAAGTDIKELAGASYPQMAADGRRLRAAFTAVAKIPRPVVAAVTGCALGGGLESARCANPGGGGRPARDGGPARGNARFHREWAGTATPAGRRA
jgi:hypothetical protein